CKSGSEASTRKPTTETWQGAGCLAYCYTTEETEKLELTRLAEKLGGNMELAIRQLAECKRQEKK
ncbi:hypothetical protein, partial [Parabacteroides johnsonii]